MDMVLGDTLNLNFTFLLAAVWAAKHAKKFEKSRARREAKSIRQKRKKERNRRL